MGWTKVLQEGDEAGGDYYALNRYLLTSRYHIGAVIAPNATIALVANNLYGIPFFNPVARTVTNMAIHVTTLGASANARLGIYQDGGSVYPTTLIQDAGTVSMASTGFKSINSLSIALSANTLYWIALVCDVAATISGITAGYGWQLLGYSTALNVVGFGYYRAAFTYTSLPNPFTAGGTAYNTATPKIAIYF